ncbi:MAG: TolC family protein, partial [Prolixibacteraceae bacterium]|nr:TolC family protein [Prolixibacteraceae bacterium]
GSEQEYLQADVTRHADSTEWVRQSSQLKRSKIVLNQLMAAEIQQDFISEDSISFATVPSLDILLEKGLEQNNFLRLQNEKWIVSQQEVKILNAERYPRLHLSGAYGYYENDTEAAFIQYNRYFGPQFGLNLGVKLFDGFQLNRSIKNAELNALNKQLEIKNLQQELSALIVETWLDYTNRLQMIELGKESIGLAQRNLEIASDAYNSGSVSSLALREAQDDLFKARANLAQAIHYTKVEETVLLSVCGMLIEY